MLKHEIFYSKMPEEVKLDYSFSVSVYIHIHVILFKILFK